VIRKSGNAATPTAAHQFGHRQHAVAAISGRHAGQLLAAPGDGRVIRQEFVRGDPGQRGQIVGIDRLQITRAGAHPVGNLRQSPPDQMLGRCARQAQGDVGIATAEVGEIVGGAQLEVSAG
jgi:hypothetical protein